MRVLAHLLVDGHVGGRCKHLQPGRNRRGRRFWATIFRLRDRTSIFSLSHLLALVLLRRVLFLPLLSYPRLYFLLPLPPSPRGV